MKNGNISIKKTNNNNKIKSSLDFIYISYRWNEWERFRNVFPSLFKTKTDSLTISFISHAKREKTRAIFDRRHKINPMMNYGVTISVKFCCRSFSLFSWWAQLSDIMNGVLVVGSASRRYVSPSIRFQWTRCDNESAVIKLQSNRPQSDSLSFRDHDRAIHLLVRVAISQNR